MQIGNIIRAILMAAVFGAVVLIGGGMVTRLGSRTAGTLKAAT